MISELYRKALHTTPTQMIDGHLEYRIGLTDTARVIRQQLKTTFPGVKFSVRSDRFSMGTSIDVEWTDGPTTESVREVAEYPYLAGGFDGITDHAYCISQWLMPDGSTVMCSKDGVPINADTPAVGAIRVAFGAKYIHCNRNRSTGVLERIAATLRIDWTHRTYDDESYVWHTFSHLDLTDGFPATITGISGQVFTVPPEAA